MGFCHRTESDLFLFLLLDNNTTLFIFYFYSYDDQRDQDDRTDSENKPVTTDGIGRRWLLANIPLLVSVDLIGKKIQVKLELRIKPGSSMFSQ